MQNSSPLNIFLLELDKNADLKKKKFKPEIT